MKEDNIRLEQMLERQLASWQLAKDNYSDLLSLEKKEFPGFGYGKGICVEALFNPTRSISTLADVTRSGIAERPCFLCAGNRPVEQDKLDFKALSGNAYSILVNPYPIFRKHFTVPAAEHVPQIVSDRYADMLELAARFTDYVVFYNGPESGASAPDHFHFQMGEKGFLPFERSFGKIRRDKVIGVSDAVVSLTYDYFPGLPVIESEDIASSCLAFGKVVRSLIPGRQHVERMMNLLCWKSGDTYVTVVFPRKKHRPSCYFKDSLERVRISPGTVDLCGAFIVPAVEDFAKVDAEILRGIMDEVLYKEWQPSLEVGLMSAPMIEVDFRTPYRCGESASVCGTEKFSCSGGMVEWRGKQYPSLEFAPSEGDNPEFTLRDVVIGIDFHWERKEDQIFGGGLRIICEGEKLIAVNAIEVEDYLFSVVSSEMNENAPEEFLKAHAVISRSWLLARPTLGGLCSVRDVSPGDTFAEDGGRRHIRWYDRDDHSLFDVCADDHCQRYQGKGRITGEKVRRVMDATKGQVLKYGDAICDARFSKCCGGVTELFSTCWGDEEIPYLQSIQDRPEGEMHSGEDFCNTADKALLSSVLNDYDLGTTDFYRWEVTYGQEEISELIRRKSGMDFGDIISLEPLKRGPSGRICELRITGTGMVAVIGKELEIRKFLSESHLYSSAFEVFAYASDGSLVAPGSGIIPAVFTLKGAGWGHGVGLCQIGAAVMGSRGYSYEEILYHYYRGTRIEKLY